MQERQDRLRKGLWIGEMGDVCLRLEDSDSRVGERIGDDLWVGLDLVWAVGHWRCKQGDGSPPKLARYWTGSPIR